MRYQCHINVQYAGSMKAVNYLFEYITKGTSPPGTSPRTPHNATVVAHNKVH